MGGCVLFFMGCFLERMLQLKKVQTPPNLMVMAVVMVKKVRVIRPETKSQARSEGH